jgi:hypothetical protein
MLKGLTLQELAAKIDANKADKHDMIADTRTTVMTVAAPTPTDGLALHIQDQGSFPIQPVAHRQIAERTGIPAKYYDRMAANAPYLLASNVNHWFAANPEQRMVRTMGGRVRAFLSNRYQRIENEEIAQTVLPILAEIPGVQVISSEITESRMYIQAITPRRMAVKVGDEVQAGVIISNSEIGLGSVSVSPLVYRLVCKNGMVSSDGRLRAYHVGRLIADNDALWADDTRKADDRAVLLKVRDTVTAAVDAVKFRERVERMSGLTTMSVGGNPAKAVEVLAQKVGASGDETAGILRALIEGADLSAWGMLNAVTAQAHTAANYDRSVELETAGGALLDLAPNQWREILEAA